jgi:hypothetical protein
MDNFLNRQVGDTQRPGGFFARILHWLAGFFQLTEEEQGEAGIYLGDQDSRGYLPDTTSVKKYSSRLDDKEKT